jgi:hypothetical protein
MKRLRDILVGLFVASISVIGGGFMVQYLWSAHSRGGYFGAIIFGLAALGGVVLGLMWAFLPKEENLPTPLKDRNKRQTKKGHKPEDEDRVTGATAVGTGMAISNDDLNSDISGDIDFDVDV